MNDQITNISINADTSSLSNRDSVVSQSSLGASISFQTNVTVTLLHADISHLSTQSDEKIISVYRWVGQRAEYNITSHGYVYLLPNVNAMEYYHLIYPSRGDGCIFVKVPK